MLHIFISYRREDSPGHAGRLFDSLEQRFGSGHVYLDAALIQPGRNFHDVLGRAISAANVMLIVIGPRWLLATNEAGVSRLSNTDDIVRQEVHAALEREITVIPVLVNGAFMPRAQDLPRPLDILAFLQAIDLRDQYWRTDVDMLTRHLDMSAERAETPSEGVTAAARSLVGVGARHCPDDDDLPPSTLWCSESITSRDLSRLDDDHLRGQRQVPSKIVRPATAQPAPEDHPPLLAWLPLVLLVIATAVCMVVLVLALEG